MNSNMHSRAGLVALVFLLIISLVSAAPIPPRSGLSSTSSLRLSHRDFIQRDTGKESTLSATTRVVRRDTFIETDDWLVRRSKIKAAFQKVGNKIKSFMKNTGAKIAKFGLKLVESYETIGAKIAGFIPGLKTVGKAMEAVAKTAGFIGDQIHTKLPGKLQKGFNAMSKAIKYADKIPRRRDLSEEA